MTLALEHPTADVRSVVDVIASSWLADTSVVRALGLDFEAVCSAVWRDLSTDSASDYRRVLVNLIRYVRDQPQQRREPKAPMFDQLGPYTLLRELGRGGYGQAGLAEHTDSGQRVCVKLNSNAEGMVRDWLDGDLPTQFLKVYEWGVHTDALGQSWMWAARELADETWADYRQRLGHEPPIDEALAVFAVACEGVAAMHERQVYRWSAHERNIFRVGSEWKLGDLGRNVMAATADDPRFLRLYHLQGLPMQERPAFLDSLNAGPWRGQTSAGAFPRDPVLEARLRLDDCASLAGLLVDLLGRERWELFFRTINTRPMGHTRYTLTGNGKIDRQLSKVVNHAWMGDGGGALSVADGEPWNTGYVDALELLADVDACFLAAVKPSGISCP